MTSFPGSPRLLKGAIVAVGSLIPLPTVIILQYNPETMRRTLQAQTVGGDGDRAAAPRLKGPPIENISLEAELDATDQLEQGDSIATTLGLYPQLSALELLLYPGSGTVIANAILAAVGTIEIVPPDAPLTLFIWGLKRIVPVRLSQFTINEQAFDPNLNPIRASVSLEMRVLTYNDLPITNPGYALSLAHQVMKEAMAAVNSVNSLAAVAGGGVSLV